MKLELDLTNELWNMLNPCWDGNIENQNIGWKPRPDIIIIPIMTQNIATDIIPFTNFSYVKAFLVQVEGFEPVIRPIKNEHLIIEDNGNTYVEIEGKTIIINSNVRQLRRVK